MIPGSFQRHINLEHRIGHLGKQNKNNALDNNFSPVEKWIILYLGRCDLNRWNVFLQRIANNLENHNTLDQIYSNLESGQPAFPSADSRSNSLHVRRAFHELSSIDKTSAYLNLRTYPNHAELNVSRAPFERTSIKVLLPIRKEKKARI